MAVLPFSPIALAGSFALLNILCHQLMMCINKQSLMSVLGESRDAESDSCLSSVWGKKQKY